LAKAAESDRGLVTADRLTSVAARLFRKKGYAATTTREIAHAAGIQKASLYHHFQTKEDLLYVICVNGLQRLTDDVTTAIEDAGATSRLRVLCKTHILTARHDQDYFAVMLNELRSLSDDRRRDVLERRDGYERLLYETIVSEQAEGRARTDIPARYLTLALLDLLNASIFWNERGSRLGQTELGSLVADIFINGATGPSGSSRATVDSHLPKS
jgi:AcrR family transcriptional regulator